MILAMTIVTFLAQGSMVKALIMAVLGVGLSQIGIDIVTGHSRFTFGLPNLEDGIKLVPLVMGASGSRRF